MQECKRVYIFTDRNRKSVTSEVNGYRESNTFILVRNMDINTKRNTKNVFKCFLLRSRVGED